jgi:hypothetical protein
MKNYTFSNRKDPTETFQATSFESALSIACDFFYGEMPHNWVDSGNSVWTFLRRDKPGEGNVIATVYYYE